MDDFPTKLADFLETTAHRARSLTVDRVAAWTKLGALGLAAAILFLFALLVLLIGLFRLLARLVGVTPAYAILGGVFLIAGALLWSKRKQPAEDQQ